MRKPKSELDSIYDHYRCPFCDHSLLRPAKDIPGMACPIHGIVNPNYSTAVAYLAFGDDGGVYEEDSEAIDLLVAFVDQCPNKDCEICTKTRTFLDPILAGRHESAMETHCRWRKHKDAHIRGGKGTCSVCGRYWQRFDGEWFRGPRLKKDVA